MKTLFRRILTGWILAFGLTGGYWGMAMRPINRWAMYFSHLDFWALLFLTLAEGTLLGLGAFALERVFPRAKPLLSATFFGWLAIVAANNFPELHKVLAARMGCKWLTGPVWWVVVWTVGACGIAGTLLFPSWRRGAARGWNLVRRLLWPVVFLVPLSLWRLPALDGACGKGLDFSPVPGNGEPPVVVLMFDMMGYGTLFDDGGQVVPACTNFAAFCARADVYHGAESAGGQTATSLPGFVVQERLATPSRKLRYAIGGWPFSDGTNTVYPADFADRSLPALARERGGRAQAIGMYVPWDVIVPGLWDADESIALGYGNHGVHVFGQAPSFRTAAAEHAARYFLYASKSPASALFRFAGLHDRTEARGYAERTSLVARADRLLRESLSPGDFVFIHVDMPHDPYVVGRGGKPLPPALLFDNVAGLAAQTEGADWALGTWLEAIASSPAGRDAWIIVTSDHNVHDPRFRKGAQKHVPFIVHRPGQTERHDVYGPADLTDLRHVLPDLPLFAGPPRTEQAGE